MIVKPLQNLDLKTSGGEISRSPELLVLKSNLSGCLYASETGRAPRRHDRHDCHDARWYQVSGTFNMEVDGMTSRAIRSK